MIQFSEGGSAFLAGKSLPNEKGKLQVLPCKVSTFRAVLGIMQLSACKASILGAVAGAHFARDLRMSSCSDVDCN